MALTTFRPNGNVANSAGWAGSPAGSSLFTYVADDVNDPSVDTTVINSGASDPGTLSFQLTDAPAGFTPGSINAANIVVRVKWTGWSNDTMTIRFRLTDSAGTELVSSGGSMSASLFTDTLTTYTYPMDVAVLNALTGADWNGLRISVVTAYTAVGGNDSAFWTISAAQLDVDYGAPLLVDGARSATRAGTALLGQQSDVVVGGARSVTRAGAAVLGQSSALTVHGATSATRAGSPLLAAGAPVVVDGARAATRAGSPLLAQASALVVDGARSASRADLVRLTAAGEVVVAGVRSATRTTTPVLGQQSGLVVLGVRADTRSGTPQLGQVTQLVVAGERSPTRAGVPLLVGPDAITVRPVRASSRAGVVLLGQHQPGPVVDGVRSVTRVPAVPVAQLTALLLDLVWVGTRVGSPLLAQTSGLTVAAARAATRARTVVMPGAVFPTAPPERTTLVPADPRLAAVPAGARAGVVPTDPRVALVAAASRTALVPSGSRTVRVPPSSS